MGGSSPMGSKVMDRFRWHCILRKPRPYRYISVPSDWPMTVSRSSPPSFPMARAKSTLRLWPSHTKRLPWSGMSTAAQPSSDAASAAEAVTGRHHWVRAACHRSKSSQP
eukprot:4508431-Pyramimonas_sp.AAC.2